MNECLKKRDFDGIYFRAERDERGVTTISAYDLLSDEDREAIAWVREHGGLDIAASRFESGEIAADMLWGKGHGRFWTTDEFEEEISKRLMPADCEWPRFEDGEPLRVGDKLMTSDGAVRVEELSLTICDTDGGVTCVPFGERVKRPAPKAVDADGVKIRVGDTVWDVESGIEYEVVGIHTDEDTPIRVMRTDGSHLAKAAKPSTLTHQRPVLDADGVPIHEGDTVYGAVFGGPFTVTEVSDKGSVFVDAFPDTGMHGYMFTHAKPEQDSWERIEEDKDLNPFDYCKKVGHKLWTFDNAEEFKASDLVRRCRALAERGGL